MDGTTDPRTLVNPRMMLVAALGLAFTHLPSLASAQDQNAGPAPQRVVAPRIVLQQAEIVPEDVAPPARPMPELLADLDSPVLSVRVQATYELMEGSGLSVGDLEQALRSEDLTAEQRARLEVAARERFVRSPRAAMGIQWDPSLPNRAIIEGTIPGFDSDVKLRAGDVFVKVNGEFLDESTPQDDLRSHILSRDPGERLSVVVRRGAELVPLEIELGSYSQLGQGRLPPPSSLADAWHMRLCRAVARVEAADLGLDPSAWILERQSARTAEHDRMIRREGASLIQAVVPGGVPRVGPDDEQELRRWRATVGKRGIPPHVRQRLDLGLAEVALVQRREGPSLRDEVRLLERRIEALVQQVEQQRLAPAEEQPNVGVSPDAPPVAVRRQATPETRLLAARRALESLRAEAAERGVDVDTPLEEFADEGE